MMAARAGWRHRAMALVLFGVGALGAGPGHAGQVVVRSTAPYWQVGVMDTTLSRLCATGLFNQREVDRYTAVFNGPTGAGALGIAKGTGLNLRDVKHKAVRNEDYFFKEDGTSACAVYVGGRKPPKKP